MANDPWSPMPSADLSSASGLMDSSRVLQNDDAWSPVLGGSQQIGAYEAHATQSIDPFSPMAQKDLTDFDMLRNEIETNGKNGNGGQCCVVGSFKKRLETAFKKEVFGILGTTSPNPFDLGDMSTIMPPNTGAKPKKSVQSILGEHSNLVNLDNLVSETKTQGEFNVFWLHSGRRPLFKANFVLKNANYFF